jgi:hypothetical protein
MKIGILSYYDTGHNYGQVLQCYALQEFLRRQGHEPYHIRYRRTGLSKLGKVRKLITVALRGKLGEVLRQRHDARNPVFLTKTAMQERDLREHPRGFDSFRDRYMKFSEKEYTYAELKNDAPEAECYIAGSDQIWGMPDGGYFMNFGPKSVRRIAYAPSFGGVKYKGTYMMPEFRKYLKKIDVVTSREADGVEQCRAAGRDDAFIVPDPVFLLNAESYRAVGERPVAGKKPYVFVYMLGNETGVEVGEIFRWAESRGLDVHYVTAQGRFDDMPKEYPSIERWLGLLDGADYVLTNSFHGMAMSLILNKRLLVFPLVDHLTRMNSRLHTTLGMLGLEDRIYRNSLDEVLAPLCYTDANARMAKQREDITSLFKKWLS